MIPYFDPIDGRPSRLLGPVGLVDKRDLGIARQRLVDDAIAFGQLEQRGELFGRRVAVEVEAQANVGEADRGLLVDV